MLAKRLLPATPRLCPRLQVTSAAHSDPSPIMCAVTNWQLHPESLDCLNVHTYVSVGARTKSNPLGISPLPRSRIGAKISSVPRKYTSHDRCQESLPRPCAGPRLWGTSKNVILATSHGHGPNKIGLLIGSNSSFESGCS